MPDVTGPGRAAEVERGPEAGEAAKIEEQKEFEVTPEMRQAHAEAFEAAVEALEKEVVCEPGRVAATLVGVKSAFEEWDDGQIDGPMPPLATLEALRAQFQYVFVDERAWTQVPDYLAQVHRVFDTHMGGGTSMSYKLFALFKRGLSSIRSAVQSGSQELAFCEAIKLTKVMAVFDDWWADTDIPEAVVKIVRELSAVWRSILATPREPRDTTTLMMWLGAIKKSWEVEAADLLGVKLAFAFEARPSSAQASAPKKRTSSGLAMPEPAKKKGAAAISAASADTEAWLHRLDSDLPQRQASAVQLRCEADVGGKKRALVVSGAYPLKAVGFAIAEAFGKAVDQFDPHPNKGKAPPGLTFTIQRDGQQQTLKGAVKIVQAVQEPSDQICVGMDGLRVVVKLDAIKLKSDAGFEHVKSRPMPRCVGGDTSLSSQLLKRLNRTFFHDRKPIDFLGCSKREAVNETIDQMARPIALRQGEPVVEGYGLAVGFPEDPGAVPGHSLLPLAF